MTNQENHEPTYMLDTNVFSGLAQGAIGLDCLPNKGKYVCLFVQAQEINATTSQVLKEKILATFEQISAHREPSETSLWGVTPWGEGGYGAAGDIYSAILRELEDTKRSRGNSNDALIAEVCLTRNYTLISSDQRLCDVVKAQGGSVLYLDCR